MAASISEDKNCNEIEVDPDEITVSAFEGKDKFHPKKYIKHKSSGKQKSFLCYSKYIYCVANLFEVQILKFWILMSFKRTEQCIMG